MVLIPKQPEGFQQAAEEALSSTFLLLQKLGPSCFLLLSPTDEGRTEEATSTSTHGKQKFKVTLGAPHHCSCRRCGPPIACIHTLFVILKILGVPSTHPFASSLSATDQEVTDLLMYREKERERTERATENSRKAAERRESFLSRRKNGSGAEPAVSSDATPQRQVTVNDICPICHDPLVDENKPKRKNAWCESGCGQNIHVSCMNHWAEHRSTTLGEKVVTCPMCRVEWTKEQIGRLRMTNAKQQRSKAHHAGTICKKCRMIPIRGKLYACVLCEKLPCFFCEECYAHPDRVHQHHPFVCQEKPMGKINMAPDRVDLLLADFAPQHQFPLHTYLARLLGDWEPPYDAWRAKSKEEPGAVCGSTTAPIPGSRRPSGGKGPRHGPRSSAPMATAFLSSNTTTRKPTTYNSLASHIMCEESKTCAWGCNIRPCHLEEPERGRLLRLRCGHVGHASCARQQFESDNFQCPSCREPLFLGMRLLECFSLAAEEQKENQKAKTQGSERVERARSAQQLGKKVSKRRPSMATELLSRDILSLQINGISL